MITPEMFAEWKENPVTREIFRELNREKELLLGKVADGQTLGVTSDVTHGQTSRLVGQIEGINQLLEISFAAPEERTVSYDESEVITGYM